MNLCTNAYHSMRNSGGVLRVDLNEIDISKTDCFPGYHISKGKYLMLEVCDTGQGMDQVTLDKAFDPYFTTKKVGEGTGLGLALVFGIVKDHEGYIIADSDPGKGSSFKVFLPITEKPKTNINNQIEAGVLVGGTERIMIVDDEKSILSVATDLLEGFGYRVSSYSKPIQALNEFEKDPGAFDLIITDMTMPKMTGDELSSNILKIRGEMPIILCTGYNENISKQKAFKMGIKEYMQKPVDNQKLILLVRQLLDNNEAE